MNDATSPKGIAGSEIKNGLVVPRRPPPCDWLDTAALQAEHAEHDVDGEPRSIFGLQCGFEHSIDHHLPPRAGLDRVSFAALEKAVYRGKNLFSASSGSNAEKREC